METILVLFWMALSSVLFLREKFLGVAMMAALLVLTRIDGLVWAGLLFLAVTQKNPRKAFIGAGVGALILLAWFGWAWSVFGMPLPHSVLAKSTIRPLSLQGSIFELSHILKWLKATIVQWSAVSAGIPIGLLAFGYGLYRLFKAKRSPLVGFMCLCVGLPISILCPKSPLFLLGMVPLYWAGLVVGVVGLFEPKWPHQKKSSEGTYCWGGFAVLCTEDRCQSFRSFRMLQDNEEILTGKSRQVA